MLHVDGVRLGSDSRISHEFPAGQISVLLGREGSGKTRLCRVLAGLDDAEAGVVTLDGTDLLRQPARARSVALVTQAFVNYPHWTVAQNIASPLKAQRCDVAEQNRIVAEVAERLGLTALLDRLPDELSGGQQQRVAIARALAQRARVLLMIEPLVNLDFKLREELREEMRGLLHDKELHVIYASADPVDAFALADQVVLLDRGRVLQSGTPLEVYREPVSWLAADLLSDPGVNRLDGDAVRPEHVILGGLNEANSVQVELLVEEVETNGSETIVHGLVGEADWVVRHPGMRAVEIGETIVCGIHESDLLTIGAASG